MNDCEIKQELIDLNLEMGVAEKARDDGYFEKVLHTKLQFRRANGDVVNKDGFLTAMREGKVKHKYLFIPPKNIEVTVYEDTAVVSLLLLASGTKKVPNSDVEEDWEGVFRNTRIFLKVEGQWQCAFWFNTRIGSLKE